MATDDRIISGALSTSTPKPVAAPTSHFYPFAASPDIIRAHEKDAYLTGSLANQINSIIRTLRGARFVHNHADAIKNLTELLYFSLTTLIGNRTLGEEYCDVIQLEDGSLQLPSLVRRTGYILSSILVPWTLQRLLPTFRRKLRVKLERNIASLQARSVSLLKEERRRRQQQTRGPSKSLRFQMYILEHLDSLTSLSPIYALNLAAFNFTGSYYHISKRFWGLRYIFSKRIGESEERIGYEVLGVLLTLQITVQAILHGDQVYGLPV